MQHGPVSRSRARRKHWLAALCLAPLFLGGCACHDGMPDEWAWDDRAWDAALESPDTDDADGTENPECRAEDLTRRSQLSAEFAGRADPALLRAARLDAERACNRALGPARGYAAIK